MNVHATARRARPLGAARRRAEVYADARLHLAALSIVAGCIHAVVASPHFGESVLYGALFSCLGAFQLGWGVAIYARPGARLYRLGVTVNLAVVIVWLFSRTSGLPVGPEPWQPEAIGPLDVAATVIELGVVAMCAGFIRTEGRPLDAASLRIPVPCARVAALTAMTAGLALLVLGAGHHA